MDSVYVVWDKHGVYGAFVSKKEQVINVMKKG